MVRNLGLEMRSRFFLIGRNLKEFKCLRVKKKQRFILLIFFKNPLHKPFRVFRFKPLSFFSFLSLRLIINSRHYVQKFWLTEKQELWLQKNNIFQESAPCIPSHLFSLLRK